MSYLIAPIFLISGRAGTGKTHLLCDLTLKKLNAKKPILMVLAQDFNNITDPLDQIAKETRFAKSKHQLLENLAGLADKISERALIIIDGINEGDSEGALRGPLSQFLSALYLKPLDFLSKKSGATCSRGVAGGSKRVMNY